MNILVTLLISSLAVFISAYILPGVNVDNFVVAIMVAIVLGVINVFLKPVLLIFTLPINIMTLGLFTFVINALIILLVSYLVPGFHVDSFSWALLFSLVLALINGFLQSLS